MRSAPPAGAISLPEAARKSGWAVRTLRWHCRHDWVGRGLAWLVQDRAAGRREWWISPQAHTRLRGTRDGGGGTTIHLEDHPERIREKALSKLALVRKLEDLLAAEPQTPIVSLARRLVPHPSSLVLRPSSLGSVLRWYYAHRRNGLAGLIDDYSGSGRPGRRSPECIALFGRIWLNGKKRSTRRCHEHVRDYACSHQLDWPESCRSTERWVDQFYPKDVVCLGREGMTRYKSRFADYVEMDYSGFAPGEYQVADHRQLDLQCLYQGKLIRPWITANLCCRTRMFTGWVLSPSPNSDTIAETFRIAYTTCGIPTHQKIDNGRDFDSRRLTGISKAARQMDRSRRQREEQRIDCTQVAWAGFLPELGIQIHWAIPYEAQSKPVENTFKIVSNDFDNCFDSYRGRTTTERAEVDDTAKLDPPGPVPQFDEVFSLLNTWIHDVYHQRPQEGLLGGQSPAQTWAALDKRQRMADPAELRILSGIIPNERPGSQGLYTVGKNGISIRIAGQSYRYGRDEPALFALKGRQVYVSVDPQDVTRIEVWDQKRTRICTARLNERIVPHSGAASMEAARQIGRRKSQAKKRLKDYRGDAIVAIQPAARQLIDAQARSAERQQAVLPTGTEGVTSFLPVTAGFRQTSSELRVASSELQTDSLPRLRLRAILDADDSAFDPFAKSKSG